MKIISKFKDYYDYLANIYGIDDHVVYLRNEIKSDKYSLRFSGITGEESLVVNGVVKNFLSWPRNNNWHLRYLIVMGRQYLVVKRAFITASTYQEHIEQNRWEIFDPKKHDVFNKESPSHSRYWWREEPKGLIYYFGSFHEEWVKVSKEIQQPIFMVDSTSHDGNIMIETNIPRLSDYHFGSIMTPEQMYQELEYFIGNTLKDNPDIVPPVNVSDKDQIVAKGFDPIVSFRKRKNT